MRAWTASNKDLNVVSSGHRKRLSEECDLSQVDQEMRAQDQEFFENIEAISSSEETRACQKKKET